MPRNLIDKIDSKKAKVGIIGLGYVGLPLAVEFAQAGLETVGVDLDDEKVAEVNAGRSYIKDVPGATVSEVVGSAKLCATTDFAVLADVDCICISVPTPLSKTKDPDISYIVAACDAIVQYFQPGATHCAREHDVPRYDGGSYSAEVE